MAKKNRGAGTGTTTFYQCVNKADGVGTTTGINKVDWGEIIAPDNATHIAGIAAGMGLDTRTTAEAGIYFVTLNVADPDGVTVTNETFIVGAFSGDVVTNVSSEPSPMLRQPLNIPITGGTAMNLSGGISTNTMTGDMDCTGLIVTANGKLDKEWYREFGSNLQPDNATGGDVGFAPDAGNAASEKVDTKEAKIPGNTKLLGITAIVAGVDNATDQGKAMGGFVELSTAIPSWNAKHHQYPTGNRHASLGTPTDSAGPSEKQYWPVRGWATTKTRTVNATYEVPAVAGQETPVAYGVVYER